MASEELLLNNDRAVYALMRDKTAAEYIDTMGLTTQLIEEFCRNQELNVSARRNDREIEDKTKPPLMAGYFFYYLYCHQQVPTQKEFGEFYRKLNENWISEKVKPEHMEGLNGRLARFYASIVREFHFYHLIKESGQFEGVSYTLRQDIEHKIDVLVEKEKRKYGIQLRVMTKNSKKYADKKGGRGYRETDAILVDLPIDLDKAKRIPTLKDTFLFYDSTYIEMIDEHTIILGAELEEELPDWKKKMSQLYKN